MWREWLTAARLRLKALAMRRELERDLEEEMQFHLEMREEKNRALGIAPKDAQAAARRRFGNVTLVKEDCRENWTFTWIETIWQDFRYAVRSFAKSPGFAAVVICSLALGTGANTAIFSVVYAILLDPYPYKDAARIVHVELHDKNGQFSQLLVNGFQFEAVRRVSSVDDVFFQDGGQEKNLTSDNSPLALNVGFYTLNVFEFLGVPPVLGRAFTPADVGNPAPVAVLSYRLWQEHYGGSRGILGKNIELDHVPYTVIGVMPPRFTWGDSDVYLPEAPTADPHYYWMAFPKLKRGANFSATQAELQALVDRFAKADPDHYAQQSRVRIATLNDEVLGRFARSIVLLFGAVVALLVIGCANVSILLLGRGIARHREFAVRTSLGAGRGRLVRQLLTESVLLAVTGAGLGLLAAYWGVYLIRGMLPSESLPREASIQLSLPVLAFSALIAVTSGILFGLSSALELSRPQLASCLQSGSVKFVGGSQVRKMHRLPIAAQVALTLLLLTGAGGAVKAFLARVHAPLGFDPDHVFWIFVEIPEPTAPTRQERIQQAINLHEAIREAVSQTPGVAQAGVSATWRPGFRGHTTRIEIQSKPSLGDAQAVLSLISPQLLSVLRMPLYRGRNFDSDEVRRQAHVAMVNQAFGKQFLGDLDPTGQRVRFPPLDSRSRDVVSPPALDQWFEIVGVVGDASNDDLAHPVKPAVFVPYSLGSAPLGAVYFVRASEDPQTAIRSVKARLRELNPDIVAIREHVVQQVLDTEGWGRERLIAAIFGLYAAVALVLAATGLYSVVSFAVTQRMRELGIRMALGAQRSSIVQLVLTSTAAMLATGIAAGLTIGAFLGPLVSSWGGGKLAEPLTLLGAASVLTLVAGIACFFPAWRAASIDPMQTLRAE